MRDEGGPDVGRRRRTRLCAWRAEALRLGRAAVVALVVIVLVLLMLHSSGLPTIDVKLLYASLSAAGPLG